MLRAALLAEQEAASEFAKVENARGRDSPECVAAGKRLAAARRRSDRQRTVSEKAAFRKAVALLGLGVEPHEVEALAVVSAVAGFALGAAAALMVLLAAGWSVAGNLPILVSAALMLAVAGYITSSQMPMMMARRLTLGSLGKSPETVCYLAMSLNHVPSLEKAVRFASENSEEPLSGALRKVIWSVETRQSLSIEDAFSDFASEWSGDSEELKMAFHSVRASVSEGTKEGRARALEKATEAALSGTRRRIEEFAASLSGPSTILFALGILLPLVVGSMLPMMAIGTLDVSNLAEGPASGGDARSSAVMTVLLMDVAFPGLAFAYAYTILGRRPGTSAPPAARAGDAGAAVPLALMVSMAMGAALFASYGSEASMLVAALLSLGAFSVPVGYWLASGVSQARAERARLMAMESQFPDAFYQLGRRVSEGTPLEAALPAVGGKMRGTEIGALFQRAGAAMRSSGLPPERALFDKDFGALQDCGSRTIRAAMRSAVASTEMDPQTAGKMMMDFSRYLRGLQDAARATRLQLSGISENMKSTATLFAPLIMGVTVGLFSMLSRTFGELGPGIEMMPLWAFAASVGVYLALMALVISHFCSRLLYGDDEVEFRWRAGTTLAMSWLIYSAAVMAAYSLFA
jgi:hypothetical protein